MEEVTATAFIRPPLRVIASEGWSLKEWLVSVGDELHFNQRVAILRSTKTGAVDHALAPRAGKLAKILLLKGSSVPLAQDEKGPPLAKITYCPHLIAHMGLCTLCGADVTIRHFAEIVPVEKQRLPVAYDADTLSITRAEAESAASVICENLLSARKLSLVLDLDHTLVHASDDPRAVAVLDYSPPGADVGSIKSFVLGPPPHVKLRSRQSSQCNMFVKLRPHLTEFLDRLSHRFELSIYTMGSRPYADQVVGIIDPDKKLFRGRVTSREDFEEGQLNQKNLERLFPCDVSMVLIVDDREDVWISGTGEFFMPNLVRAKPYYFWNGLSEVYDRASSSLNFMPVQAPKMTVTSVDTTQSTKKDVMGVKQRKATKSNGKSNSCLSPLNGCVNANSNKAPSKRPLANQRNDIHLSNSIANGDASNHTSGVKKVTSGVAKLQEDKNVESLKPTISNGETNGSVVHSAHLSSIKEDGSPNSAVTTNADACDPPKERGPATTGTDLDNCDPENNDVFKAEMRALVQHWWKLDSSSEFSDHLLRIADVLELVHKRFFEKVDTWNATRRHVSRGNGSKLMPYEYGANVKKLLAGMREPLFKGCIFTFTGVFPQDSIPEKTSIWNFAERHGALCSHHFESGLTTHVIASATRGACTEKSKRAVLENTAFCVTTAWLEDSMMSWERLPELSYSIHPPCNHTNWEDFRKEVDSCRAVKYDKLVRDSELSPVDRISYLKKRQQHQGASFAHLDKRRKLMGGEEPLTATLGGSPISAYVDSETQLAESRILTGDEITDALDELI